MVHLDTSGNAASAAATHGSDRQGHGTLELDLLHAVLEQVDYGLAVVHAHTHQVLFANAPAHSALHPASLQKTGLCKVNGVLHTRQSGPGAGTEHSQQLAQALLRTQTGLRGLLSLGDGSGESTVAVLPLSALGYALLVFAKQQMCDSTSITLFARERGLTGAEGQVLSQVCKGLRPAQIATHQGVQISTVRTQLRSIRTKTACDSIRELVEKVSVLPPMAYHLPSHLPQWLGAAVGGRQAAFA